MYRVLVICYLHSISFSYVLCHVSAKFWHQSMQLGPQPPASEVDISNYGLQTSHLRRLPRLSTSLLQLYPCEGDLLESRKGKCLALKYFHIDLQPTLSNLLGQLKKLEFFEHEFCISVTFTKDFGQ